MTFSVTVNDPDTGNQVLLTDAATPPRPGITVPPGSTDPRCTSSRNHPDTRADHHQDRQHQHDHARVRRRTPSPSPTPARPPTPAPPSPTPDQRPGRRHLRRRRHRHHRAADLCQPGPDLDRKPGRRRDRHHHLLSHRQQPRHRRKLLINSVSSTAAGSACPPGSENSGCRVTVGILTPALTITKTASTQTTMPGDTVHLHDHRHQHRPDRLRPRRHHRPADRRAR